LRVECGASVSLAQGSKGAFEITVEGRLVHSKLATGLIPKAEKIMEFLNSSGS
jgi:selT/selW/selH-like putative selenoprotein